MFWASKTLIWLPLFAIILYMVIRTFHWKTITVVLAVAILIAISDQLTNLSKNEFKRLRPSHEASLAPEVHTVYNYRGGDFGFYSAHASNTFAIAVFLTVIFRRKYRFLPVFLFSWAAIMSFTRIYLGVHYPGDVLSGILIGSLLGFGLGKLTMIFLKYKDL